MKPMKSAPSEHDSQLEKHQLKFSGLTALFFLALATVGRRRDE